MEMKCPVCQSENPEGKKFCGDCGGVLPQPTVPSEEQPVLAVSTQPKGWLASHWKILASIAIVLVVVLASIGLIYTQSWSKIKVLVAHDEHSTIGVNIYIDGVLKASVGVSPGGWKIIGVWATTAGSHTVAIDSGAWHYYPGGWLTDPYWYYEEPDGELDFVYTYEVGPLYTKNAYVQL
jgi:hypothetical protein